MPLTQLNSDEIQDGTIAWDDLDDDLKARFNRLYPKYYVDGGNATAYTAFRFVVDEGNASSLFSPITAVDGGGALQ